MSGGGRGRGHMGEGEGKARGRKIRGGSVLAEEDMVGTSNASYVHDIESQNVAAPIIASSM
jgi:hypothetical protein